VPAVLNERGIRMKKQAGLWLMFLIAAIGILLVARTTGLF
jgi:hypothetical protein